MRGKISICQKRLQKNFHKILKAKENVAKKVAADKTNYFSKSAYIVVLFGYWEHERTWSTM